MSLVLITGATGHIGFRTLAKALEAGYRARVTSRSLASAEKLKDLPSIKPYADAVEPHEIPDFLADGAFDEAVNGVEYVLHLASPLPDDTHVGQFDLDGAYIEPAIQGTVSMLKASSKSPTVKRVVITASINILAPKEGKTIVGPEDFAKAPSRADMQSNPWVAYQGSEVLGHEAAEKYTADHKPKYDVIYILPAYVQGRNETIKTAQKLYDGPSSNHTMVQYVMGKKNETPRPRNFVHVDDVAAVEVAALSSSKVSNGEHFVVSAPPIESYKEIDAVVKKLFPEEVSSGMLPLGGEQVPRGGVFDTSSTIEKLGIEIQGLQAMVESLIGQYVELLKTEMGIN